jgi:hypothetical protein
MLKSCTTLMAAALTVLALCGCGESSGPKVEYVEGIVKLDGQPVEGATVTFSPASPDGVGAVGTTDANGVYRMTALPDGAIDKGAVAGSYSVALMKVGSIDSGASISAEDPDYAKKMAEMSSGAPSAAPKSNHLIPEKFNNPATSGLKVTVKSGTNKGDEFNFDVKKQ